MNSSLKYLKMILSLILLFYPVILLANISYSRIEINGAINNITAKHVKNAFESSHLNNAEFILITIDSPGGLLNPTRSIVQNILNSKIPVITYISPMGAQASGSSIFILVASHIIAASPHAIIGPISFNNVNSTTSKYFESYIKTSNSQNKRNITQFIKMLSGDYSLSTTDAFNLHVIDYRSNNIAELVQSLNNKSIDTTTARIFINTNNISEVFHEMNLIHKALNYLSDPFIIIFLVISIILDSIFIIIRYILSKAKKDYLFLNKYTIIFTVLLSISLTLLLLVAF